MDKYQVFIIIKLFAIHQSCPRVGGTRGSGRVTILPDNGGAGRVGSALRNFLIFLHIIPWFLNRYKSSNTTFKLIVLSCSPRNNYAKIVYCSLLEIWVGLGRVGSDFLSAIAGRVNVSPGRVAFKKVTRGQLFHTLGVQPNQSKQRKERTVRVFVKQRQICRMFLMNLRKYQLTRI